MQFITKNPFSEGYDAERGRQKTERLERQAIDDRKAQHTLDSAARDAALPAFSEGGQYADHPLAKVARAAAGVRGGGQMVMHTLRSASEAAARDKREEGVYQRNRTDRATDRAEDRGFRLDDRAANYARQDVVFNRTQAAAGAREKRQQNEAYMKAGLKYYADGNAKFGAYYFGLAGVEPPAELANNRNFARLLDQGNKQARAFLPDGPKSDTYALTFAQSGGNHELALKAANAATHTAKPGTSLGKLMAERDALPPGDPRRASYEAAIAKKTSSKGMRVSVGPDGGVVFEQGVGTGSAVPDLPKLDRSYIYKRGPDGAILFDENGSPIIIPITGGPAARKIAEVEGKRGKAGQSKLLKADIILNNITRVREAVEGQSFFGPVSGAAGQLAGRISGTDAFDARALVTTMRANLGFAQLQELRDNSPTGGALGQVSDTENKLLQSTLVNLELAQSEEQFLQELDNLERIYGKIVHGIQGSQPSDVMRFRKGSATLEAPPASYSGSPEGWAQMPPEDRALFGPTQ